jgi:replicative DNA helicase
MKRVIPYIKEDYFFDYAERTIFHEIKSFIDTYDVNPTIEGLMIKLSNNTTADTSSFKSIKDTISKLTKPDIFSDLDFLIKETEKWCQFCAFNLAAQATVEIMQDKSGKKSKAVIPQLFSDALAVTFDNSVGHNYLEDFNERFQSYRNIEDKLPFDLDYMNKITGGGVPRKTLNIFMSSTGIGKSLTLCHLAGAYMMRGYNVLYITLEMSQERIAERIDANLLDVPIVDLAVLPKDVYDKKIEAIRSKTKGKIIIKEYPTASATVTHFRALLHELKIKKNFIPDVILVDYLNIAASSRLSSDASSNSYLYIKAIAEEFRGLAQEQNVPIWSATQTSRKGFSNNDVDLDHTSESWGLPATADFMAALISTEDLEKMGQILVKQLKNRYNNVMSNKRFILGIDRSKMRLYDVEESAQSDLLEKKQSDRKAEKDTPAFDKSQFGLRMKAEKISRFRSFNYDDDI